MKLAYTYLVVLLVVGIPLLVLIEFTINNDTAKFLLGGGTSILCLLITFIWREQREY